MKIDPKSEEKTTSRVTAFMLLLGILGLLSILLFHNEQPRGDQGP